MAEKQSNKERIKEITAGIEKGIQELFESDRYRNYLTTMSRFHRYSLNNVMLIHAQKPDATLVAGFNKWKNSFGRHVKKGEKGIQILAPTPYKIKQEEQKLDPDTKLPLLDENGEPVTDYLPSRSDTSHHQLQSLQSQTAWNSSSGSPDFSNLLSSLSTLLYCDLHPLSSE